MVKALALVVLAATAASGQPKCPFDARVSELMTRGAALEAVEAQWRAHPDVKKWIEDEARTCKVVTSLLPLRVLQGYSQRCAVAVFEPQLTATNCRERDVRISNGGPRYPYALAAADAKGVLRPVWPLFVSSDAIPQGKPVEFSRVECATSLVAHDGGVDRMRAIASDPSLHFDGCMLQGLSDDRVRAEVKACLAKSESEAVTVRFFEGDAGTPTCVVTTTEAEEDRVAVVRSGALVSHGPQIDSGLFVMGAGAYLDVTRDQATWLCADLELKTFSRPLDPPLAARAACAPSKNNEGRVVRANEGTRLAFVAERHDVAVATPDAGAVTLRVERAVLELGYRLDNEAELSQLLSAAMAAIGSCARTPSAYDGVVGGVVLGSGGSVSSVSFDAAAGDQDCVTRSLIDLRKFRAQKRFSDGVEVYRFKVRASR